MATWKYRKSTGEAIKRSLRDQQFEDTPYFGMLTDPTDQAGIDVQYDIDPVAKTRTPKRELGASIFCDPSTNTVRLATQPEIDAMEPGRLADISQQDADGALVNLENNPQWRKVFAAIIRGVRREDQLANAKINELVAQWEQFKADLSVSTVAQLKTAVAAYDTVAADLRTDRTMAEIRDFIKTQISGND